MLFRSRTGQQDGVSAGSRTAVPLRLLYMVCGLCRRISADQEEISRDCGRASGGCEYSGLPDLTGQYVHSLCASGDVPDTGALCGNIPKRL